MLPAARLPPPPQVDRRSTDAVVRDRPATEQQSRERRGTWRPSCSSVSRPRAEVTSTRWAWFSSSSAQEPPPSETSVPGRVPRFSNKAPGAHPRLAAIVDRCLEPEPSRRWVSAEELLDALEQVAPTHRAVPLPTGNPYRGLRPFDAEHRALFFGRDADVQAVLERLRSDSLVVVASDSGVGKSSLCRAGVLPLVIDGGLEAGQGWSVVRLVPGRDPVGHLAAAFSPVLHIDVEALRAWMHSEPAALARAFQRARMEQPALALLVFIDQSEELISLAGTDEAARFATCCGVALGASPYLRWLMTVRGDMVTRLAFLPGLGQELQSSLFILRPLSPERLREAVVGPARAFGVAFDSEEMVVVAGCGRSGFRVLS